MVLFDYDLFVFALCKRKNEKNKKIKYRFGGMQKDNQRPLSILLSIRFGATCATISRLTASHSTKKVQQNFDSLIKPISAPSDD